MRTTPLGLLFFRDPHLYEKVRASSEVTHAHPLGIDGAAVQARAITLSVILEPSRPIEIKPFLETLAHFSRTTQMRDRIGLLGRIMEQGTPPDIAAPRLGQTVAVHESVPFALYAFLRHYPSFEECLQCAVLNSGDRDTLGAMACAISGAFLGIENIPGSWIEKLENRDYIEDLASRLFMVMNEMWGG